MDRPIRGETLRSGQGSAHRTRARVARTLASLYAAAITSVSAAIGLMALALALSGSLSPGVVAEDAGGVVRSVDPWGFAWRNGIRPGQQVVSVSAADDEAGWSIETRDETGRRRATAAAATATLRQSTPLAAAAAILGILGLVAVPTRRRRAELLAALALAVAAGPLWLAENAILVAASGVLAPIALAIWAGRWLSLRTGVMVVLGVVTCLVAAIYLLARWQQNSLAADLEGVRLVGTLVFAAGVLVVASDWRPDWSSASPARLRLLDAGVGVVTLSAAAVMATAIEIPVPIVVVLAVGVLVAYAGLRSGIGRVADRILLAEVRERAAARAADEERARLSRDLHDDPLQVLAGVIHRLERQPDTLEERETLQTVAAHLRDVATELHPPVIDDLGLVPAIEELPSPRPGIDLVIDVAHGGYERQRRPPSEIEIAIFRIVQEAAANAMAHSGSRTVRIEGEVESDHVSIEVIDHGRGLSGHDIEAAMRGGHIGVASMRRRADAIDARLTHRETPGGGTTVSVRWHA